VQPSQTAGTAASSGGAGGAVLAITAGATEQGQFHPLANRKIWVMKGSADIALLDAGFTQNPYGSIMYHFMTACRQKATECQKGAERNRSAVGGVRAHGRYRASAHDAAATRSLL
jgi:hypothetical protein